MKIFMIRLGAKTHVKERYSSFSCLVDKKSNQLSN